MHQNLSRKVFHEKSAQHHTLRAKEFERRTLPRRRVVVLFKHLLLSFSRLRESHTLSLSSSLRRRI